MAWDLTVDHSTIISSLSSPNILERKVRYHTKLCGDQSQVITRVALPTGLGRSGRGRLGREGVKDSCCCVEAQTARICWQLEFRGRVKRRGGPDLGLSRQAAQTDLRSQRPLPAGVCASPSRPLAGRVWQSEGPGAAGLGEPGSPSCPLLPGDPRFQGTVLYPGPPSSRAQLLARPPRPAAPVSRPHGGPGASRAPQPRGGCCRAVPQQGPRGPSRAAPPPPPAPLPAARLRARRRPATRPLRRLAARLQLSQPRWGLTMLFKLVSKNSWAQAILLPQPPKELGPTTPTDSHGPETEPP
ncbi:uncharacterized protein [Chlorocebus sabaeus]|uniref:uncharacterized protein n=1 Tax=Chlorocebus sabaeus TaxID=60711 RepID=UPI003BF98A18